MSTTSCAPPFLPVIPCMPNCRPGAFAQARRASAFGGERCSRGGFTLIELLICIAIIALLSVLLIPYINSALGSAKSVKCINNLHQIGVMTELYCADSGNILPSCTSWTCGGSSYLELLVAQVKGVSVYDAREAMARGEVPSHCPVVLPGDNDIKGTAPSGAKYWINYGINYVNLGGTMTMAGPANFSRLNVSYPSKCIYVADGQNGLLNANGAPWQASARHHGKSNVLWMDGHVTSELTSTLLYPAAAVYVENWWSTR